MNFPIISNERAAHLKELRDMQDRLMRDLTKAFGINESTLGRLRRGFDKEMGYLIRAEEGEMLDG